MVQIEIVTDETGKTVIRAKSSASQQSKATSVFSRHSSQRSLAVDLQSTEIMGKFYLNYIEIVLQQNVYQHGTDVIVFRFC